MTSRILPRDEWSRLAHTELGGLDLGTLDAKVIVVEDDAGEIVGCWSAFNVLHVEGVWIAPAYRGKTTVARRLWQGMLRLVRSHGARAVWTGSASEMVTRLLEHHGAVPVAMQSFVLSVGEPTVER